MLSGDSKLLDAIPQPIWIYDVDSLRFLVVNRAAMACYGYSEAEFLAMTIEDIRPPEDVPELHRVLNLANANGEGPPRHRVWTHVRKDGSRIAVEVCTHPIEYEGHRARVVAALDVTKRLKAERRVNDYLDRLEKVMSATVSAISHMMEMRDPYTAAHEKRTADIARAIGREMGLSEKAQQGVEIAAGVHDIGKISIPAEILAKPGMLTAAEYDIIKSHPRSGYEILRRVDFPWPVAEVARQHHERSDGSGYPRALKGEEILLEARIVAVADVIEAMTSHRPYRASQGLDKALEEIEREAGRRYDRAVADACLTLFRERDFRIAP